jgi:hypothetical protein
MRRERLEQPDDFDPRLAEAAAEAQYRARSADDFLLFLSGLVIPSAQGPRVLGLCAAPFQKECFELLEPSLRAVRDGKLPPRRRFWLERTKKASKDADLAICLLWLMAFPKRPVLAQVSAANQQQAGIIKRRAADLLYYNPWLSSRVHIQQNRIIGCGGLGECVIEATGSSGAKQGDTPDLLILNELVHVDRWGVNETHMNNADGVPQGVVIISTNAGIKGTKAEQWKKNAVANQGRWTLCCFAGVAPWVDKRDVEDSRRRDPVGSEHRRLWGGQWVSGRGGAVEDDAIDRCFTLRGPLEYPEEGWIYLAGLDLGISHDHAGIVVLGASQRLQMIKVAWLRGYVPSVPNDRGRLEVDGAEVERACLELTRRYGISWFGYDPAAGGSFMAQHLRSKGVTMKEMTFSSPKNRNLMAVSFVQSVKGGKLQCYEDDEGRMRRDFGKFQIVSKMPSGYALEAVSDEWGHADVGTALLICLPKAIQFSGISSLFSEADVLFDDGESEMGPDVVGKASKESMPDELQGILDAYDERPSRGGGFRERVMIGDW